MSIASPHITHKRRKRKEEILNSALAMIADKGLDALTMQKLAARLGLTAGALYRYFRSKAALISGLEGQVLRDLSTQLAEELGSCDPPAALRDAALFRLWVCARFYLRQSSEQPERASLIAMLLADPKHLVADEDLPDLSADFIGIFGQLISEISSAQECGAIGAGDAQKRALVFWSSLQGVSSLEKLRRVDANFFDPTRVGHDLIASLLHGWGASPRRIKSQEQLYNTRHASKRKPRHQEN